MGKQIKRLAERIHGQVVVPFVGAGFSYGACHDSGWKTTPDRMPGLLWKKVGGMLPAVPWDPSSLTLQQGLQNAGDSLARLAEIACLVMSPREVCEALHIAEYAELRPIASHRYLAYLVREGFIREVITTNYDCCIETAFRESFDIEHEPSNELATITDLASYRELAASHARPGHLLLYKLNGCAGAYRKRRNGDDPGAWDEAANRIILTERQLQSFRQEYWARDLFRDRARSRSFLFSGFGSEEPQIRHTALELIEEFSRLYSCRRPEQAMKLENAPFIHAFESTLTFYQLQIMVAFLATHAPPLRSIAPVFSNVISPDAGEGRLSASVFMQRLYTRVFYELVMSEIEGGMALQVWLREQTREFQTWLDALRRHVIEAIHRETWDSLFAPAGHGAPFPLNIQRLFWHMYHPGRPLPMTDWYLPLREEPLFVLLTLLVFLLLETPFTAVSESDIVFDDGTGKSLSIRLVHERALQTQQPSPASHPSRMARVIAVPSHKVTAPLGRVISYEPATHGDEIRTMIVGQWSAARLGDVIAKARTPAGFKKAIQGCSTGVRRQPIPSLVPVPLAESVAS